MQNIQSRNTNFHPLMMPPGNMRINWLMFENNAETERLSQFRAPAHEYELAMMRVASKLGARAHRAAEAAFRAGASEYDINMAYLKSVHETETELPYSNIIALNQHGAVLHYTDLNRAPPTHAIARA